MINFPATLRAENNVCGNNTNGIYLNIESNLKERRISINHSYI